jgi:hypothetical protein
MVLRSGLNNTLISHTGDTAVRRQTASADVDLNAILVISATDLTMPHVRVQRRIRKNTVPVTAVRGGASSHLT